MDNINIDYHNDITIGPDSKDPTTEGDRVTIFQSQELL
jgi:hypothetical protein